MTIERFNPLDTSLTIEEMLLKYQGSTMTFRVLYGHTTVLYTIPDYGDSYGRLYIAKAPVRSDDKITTLLGQRIPFNATNEQMELPLKQLMRKYYEHLVSAGLIQKAQS